ncbi:hypothetical protein GQ457_14G004520 [Hibiscus cannabinus]
MPCSSWQQTKEALGAPHALRDLRGGRKLETATRVSDIMESVVVLLECQLKTFISNIHFPFIVATYGRQNSCGMAIDNNIRPLAKHRPSTFPAIAKQLLYL